jgi:hypothetical protein
VGLFSFLPRKKRSGQQSTAQAARAPRVTLVPLHNTFLNLHSPKTSQQIALANISASGLGFFKGEIATLPPIGALMEGTLFIQDTPVEVQTKIIHSSTNVVGCCFSHFPANFAALLNRHFQVELTAMQLGKIAQQYLKKQSDGESLWFRGPDNAELFLVLAQQTIIRFNFSFFGHLIEYFAAGNIVRYSRLAQEDDQAYGVKGSELYRQETSLPREIGELGIKFVTQIPELSASHRIFVCGVLTQAIPPQGAVIF